MTRNAIDAATATSFLLLPERRWLILVHTIPVYISLWCVYIVVKLATQLFLRGLTAVIILELVYTRMLSDIRKLKASIIFCGEQL